VLIWCERKPMLLVSCSVAADRVDLPTCPKFMHGHKLPISNSHEPELKTHGMANVYQLTNACLELGKQMRYINTWQ